MIYNDRIRSYAAGIARSYLRVLKSAGAVFIAVLAVAGISAVFVTPLWFFATKYTRFYTVVSICGLSAALVTPLIIRLIKDPSKRKPFFKRLLRGFIFLLLAVSLYFIVLLYVWGSFAIAIPLTVVHIAVTGIMLYGIYSRKN